MSEESRNVLIAGATPRCGKTVACAGIAGVLLDLGFKVQATRPLVFDQNIAPGEICVDQAYMELIEANRVMQRLETVVVPSPYDLSALLWNRMLENCKKPVYPLLIESTGSVAQPLRVEEDGFFDVLDLSDTLDAAIVLVGRKSPDVVAELAPALTYLYDGDADVLGWIAVETQAFDLPRWEQDYQLVSREYDVPFLGEIAWSPSISVEGLQQGNLLKLTEASLDLLPIQQAMNLALAAH